MIDIDALAQEIRRVDGNHSLGAGALAEALMPFLSAAHPSPSASEAQVRVKALEWDPFRAETPFGYYHIDDQTDRSDDDLKGRPPFLLSGSRIDPSRHDTLAEAKAAAQADYERRVRSALSTPEQGETAPSPETHLEGPLRILQEGIKEAEADIAFDADAGNRSDLSQYGVSLPYETAREIAALLRPEATREHRRGIYIASKTKHADRWRFLRDKVGEPIISTWIDEAGAGESGDLADLWRRCILEASTAEVLILYREPDDVLKGGWVELGAALASGVTVFAVGIEQFTIAHDKRIRHFPDIKAAIAASRRHRAALAAEGRE